MEVVVLAEGYRKISIRTSVCSSIKGRGEGCRAEILEDWSVEVRRTRVGGAINSVAAELVCLENAACTGASQGGTCVGDSQKLGRALVKTIGYARGASASEITDVLGGLKSWGDAERQIEAAHDRDIVQGDIVDS